jgi:hypothetical protein
MVSRTSKIVLLFFLIVFIGGIFVLKFQNPSKAMRELPLGSTYDQLIYIAGTPDYVTDGTVGVELDFKKAGDQLVPGCVKEAWYGYPLSLLPSKYSFCFNRDDELIHKYHWSSW